MHNIHYPDSEKQSLIDNTIQAGHAHIFRWWDRINEKGRSHLLDQLSAIDFDELNKLYKWHVEKKTAVPKAEIKPVDVISIPKEKDQIVAAKKATQIGERAIRAGDVAVLAVAGGQATRLDIDMPKGILAFTPVKRKSIFKHHAEKICALSARYENRLPFYLMTSEANDMATRQFFEENKYFGLDPADICFFKQEMMPALDFEGKLILDKCGHIFTSPNGHGGSLNSLKSSGALDDMKERGVKHIFYFQIDNALIKIADPLFLGYHIDRGAEMSAKVAPKRDPEEKVGVVSQVGETVTVIEYSELPDEHRYARNDDGSLKFSAGNLAIHVLDMAFIERLNDKRHPLPFHVAEKPVPFLNKDGKPVKSKKKNGLKFEMFVFDALGAASVTSIMEVNRKEEFAPIKNAKGEDSPKTARELMMSLHANWLEEAGISIPRDAEGRLQELVEISPLFALDADELKQKLPASFEPRFPLYLGPE